MPFLRFDRNRLSIKPLGDRIHDLNMVNVIIPLDAPPAKNENPSITKIAERIIDARQKDKPVIFFMGGHVIRKGMSAIIIDLMKKKILTHIGLNGAGVIHDFECALIGSTTESVSRYISEGQFGLWQETGRINDAAAAGTRDGLGLGEAVGRMIVTEQFPFRNLSICGMGYDLHIPVTVHVSIGQDIIHEHPNCDGKAFGYTSYEDFLIFTQTMTNLEGGVFLNVGTAVMGPEVYLKALAMVRNVAHQEGRQICHFTTAVFDLLDLGEDYHQEAPKNQAAYYFRPYKTILVRTVQDGGESFYIKGDHLDTIPALYHQIINLLS